MITPKAISDFVDRIAHEYRPDRIILFGSHAVGSPRRDSDVDLLVIMPFEGNSLRTAASMLRHLNPTFAVDLILRTPEQLEQRLGWNDMFLKEILERGKLLYAAADGRVGSKSRG